MCSFTGRPGDYNYRLGYRQDEVPNLDAQCHHFRHNPSLTREREIGQEGQSSKVIIPS